MAMTTGLLLVAAVGLAYGGAYLLLGRRPAGLLGFHRQPPFILWRTQRGLRWMRALSKPARAWRAGAAVGVAATALLGLAVVAFLAYRAWMTLTGQGALAGVHGDLRMLVGLPGINPIIPLGYGLFALVFALVVHEAAHGIVAYAHGLRLRSSGVLIFGVPLGAFVEPEEDDVNRATMGARLRVLAAGPAANLALATATALLLTTVMMPAVGVANDGEGVAIATVAPSSPAAGAGLREADVLLQIDEISLRSTNDYIRAMLNTTAGQDVRLTILRDGEVQRIDVTLANRYERLAQAPPTGGAGAGFLGASALDLQYVEGLRRILDDPLRDGAASLQLNRMPFPPGSMLLHLEYPLLVFATGVDILAPPYRGVLDVSGPLEVLPPSVFFGIASLLYWTFWLNLMLATFNALPIGPLDGGQMLATLTAGRGPAADATTPSRAARSRGITRLAGAVVVVLLVAPLASPLVQTFL